MLFHAYPCCVTILQTNWDWAAAGPRVGRSLATGEAMGSPWAGHAADGDDYYCTTMIIIGMITMIIIIVMLLFLFLYH